jgi:low affinity Fe/Cu permease
MATTSKINSENIYNRLRAAMKNNLKKKKKNPDWARVEEPDMIVRPFTFIVVATILTAFLMLFTMNIMNGSLVYWAASFLTSLHSPLPFTQLYASFGVAIVFFACFVFILLVSIQMQPDNDDIVEMISDLDANIQERIVELDNKIDEKFDAITRNE